MQVQRACGLQCDRDDDGKFVEVTFGNETQHVSQRSWGSADAPIAVGPEMKILLSLNLNRKFLVLYYCGPELKLFIKQLGLKGIRNGLC